MKRKSISLILLSLVWSSASADWVKIGQSPTHILYADPATIRKKGDIARMDELSDHMIPRKSREGKYSSLKAQREYDCLDGQSRILSEAGYSGNMGEGFFVFYGSAQGWKPIALGTVHHALWRLACGKANPGAPSSIQR